MSQTERPSIEAVLAHYGAEIPDCSFGGWVKLRCPFHDDTHPSARMNVDTDRWACFACDLSEDSIDVIIRMEGCGFRNALEVGKGIAGDSGVRVRKASRSRGSLLEPSRDNGRGGAPIPPRGGLW